MRPYRKILVPVDGSSTSARGLREAARLARVHKAEVVLLHVVNEYPAFEYAETAPLAGSIIDAMLLEGKRVLRNAQALAARLGVKTEAVLRTRVGGPAADEIVRQARKLGCDLIVIGTHGRRGLTRLVMGSDAELVVRQALVPVLLVRGK